MADTINVDNSLGGYAFDLPKELRRAQAAQLRRVTTDPVPEQPEIGTAQGVRDNYAPLMSQLASRRASLSKQLDDVNKPADYTELQGKMAAQGQQALPNTIAAGLAGLGPSFMHPMQAQFLKEAAAAQNPMRVEGGQIDARGQVMLDPSFQHQQKAALIAKQLDALDKAELAATSQQEKNAIMQERNQLLQIANMQHAQTQAMLAGMRSMIAQNAGGSMAQTQYVTPKGEPILINKQGQKFTMGGQPYGGEVVHYTALQGPERGKLTSALTQARGLRESAVTLDALTAPAKGFGVVPATAASMAGDTGQALLQKYQYKNNSPEVLHAVNQISTAANEYIHQHFGTAFTKNEALRTEFIPGPRDDIPTKVKKARILADLLETHAQGGISALPPYIQKQLLAGGYSEPPQAGGGGAYAVPQSMQRPQGAPNAAARANSYLTE